MRKNENSIKSEVANLPKVLNGPKGKVASKTVASIELLNGVTKRETPEWGSGFGRSIRFNNRIVFR